MRKFFYLCYAVMTGSILFFLSCQKEKQTGPTAQVSKVLTASNRENNPFTDNRVRLENGMLVFENYKAFTDIHDGLKDSIATLT